MPNRTFTIREGNVLAVLQGTLSASVHCVVTSPPYWGLRDYGVEPSIWDGDPNCEHDWTDESFKRRTNDAKPGAKQKTNHGAVGRDNPALCALCGAWRGCYGLEPTPDLYVQHTVQIMREIRRVLRPDGTVWLNIGDSYFGDSPARKTSGEAFSDKWNPADSAGNGGSRRSAARTNGLMPKSLCMIPARVALALQTDGWYLRSKIVWAKPAPMPESVTDRPTRSYEEIFLLTQSPRYYYDQNAVRQPLKQSSIERLDAGGKAACFGGAVKSEINDQTRLASGNEWTQDIEQGANLRDVWNISSEGFKDAHFAVFPTEIPRRAILAGTSEKGVCGQCGSPWVRVVEKANGAPESWHGSKFDDGKNLEIHPTVQRREEAKTETAYPQGTTANRLALLRQQARENGGEYVNQIKTAGWKPSCDHTGEPVPATVLDPFTGSGTTGLVALRLGRNFVGIELNPEYVKMATRRIQDDAPLFNITA